MPVYLLGDPVPPRGPAGPAGTNGLDGATGPTGIAGTNGTIGRDGATGPTGPAGTNGTAGATGSTGPTGSNGATGATGPTGPAGATGSTGVGAGVTTGSWTLTFGINTVSFTVPINGNYVMWVRGNIPNGIVVWNATVSVTNTNVAVIGTQYAWNYTGGGSPITLISIPSQIVGTAGTIITTEVSTSTSNKFDFDISNTSGSQQTVQYGYITL